MGKRKNDRHKTREKLTEGGQLAQAKRIKRLAKELRIPFRISG
ncbi:hypothetical protein [Halobacillus karajensis]|uniref:Uncharacterized protein n=1 Tax=Halobacillus karajensis TaxID=195088 RepID=A0A024P7X6_9BACI|nr:hypothetical protein [Halobacillus karajensis]CDQ20983.1 hypothetical protein BN982_03344 [Halobacillus karajensis]CDQ24953.1 hypothetical protein BN983_03254 [Halobacillus karajensis]CDQ28686.1 hypothetical protein BN981_02999 [Halobacillus karajensis]